MGSLLTGLAGGCRRKVRPDNANRTWISSVLFVGTRSVLAVLLLLFAASLPANDSAILEIRKEYKNIRDALPSLKKAELELSGYSAEGGRATAYRDSRKVIRLIRVELYGESGKVFEDFYYRNGSLIFALYESHRYNVPFYVTPETARDAGGVAFDPKKTDITEDRYYFENGTMLRWIDENKQDVSTTSQEFKDSEQAILRFSNELQVMFKQRT
jgi:hypothetical protein